MIIKSLLLTMLEFQPLVRKFFDRSITSASRGISLIAFSNSSGMDSWHYRRPQTSLGNRLSNVKLCPLRTVAIRGDWANVEVPK